MGDAITTKEQCPNYNNGKLDTSWNKYGTTGVNLSTSESSLCFNICGENHYIENLGSRQVCRQCPTQPEGWNPDEKNNETSEISELRRKGILNMCKYATLTQESNYEEPRLINQKEEWFLKQQSANIQNNFKSQINWSTDEAKLLWSHYNTYEGQNPAMTDQQLLAMFGSRVPGSFNEDNTPIYVLPSKYGNPSNKEEQIAALRIAINTGRGATIDCPGGARVPAVRGDSGETSQCEPVFLGPDMGPVNIMQYNDADGNCEISIAELQAVCSGDMYQTCLDFLATSNTPAPAAWVTCNEDNKFGVDDIIYEEAYDYWLSENDRLDPKTDTDTSGVLAFSDLMSGLSIDSNFESCVNEVLNTGENDKEIQDRISNYTKITNFNNEDINYLQGKLRKIILVKETDVNECMNMLNIGESVCTSGVSDKMLQIGHLVISIIGANKINMRELDIDDRYKLNSMVDKLGPLLPQAIKNIIDISKQYETRVCNTPSNTTLLLERLYIDLYDKQTNVTLDLSSYVDFTSIIDTPNTMDGNVRFIKTIVVIAVIGYVLVHLTDFVSKFLSRGSVKPE